MEKMFISDNVLKRCNVQDLFLINLSDIDMDSVNIIDQACDIDTLAAENDDMDNVYVYDSLNEGVECSYNDLYDVLKDNLNIFLEGAGGRKEYAFKQDMEQLEFFYNVPELVSERFSSLVNEACEIMQVENITSFKAVNKVWYERDWEDIVNNIEYILNKEYGANVVFNDYDIYEVIEYISCDDMSDIVDIIDDYDITLEYINNNRDCWNGRDFSELEEYLENRKNNGDIDV